MPNKYDDREVKELPLPNTSRPGFEYPNSQVKTREEELKEKAKDVTSDKYSLSITNFQKFLEGLEAKAELKGIQTEKQRILDLIKNFEMTSARKGAKWDYCLNLLKQKIKGED